MAIRFIEKELNKFLNEKFSTTGIDYTIASDTDSVFLNLERFYQKVFGNTNQVVDDQKIVDIFDAFCKKEIEPFIDKKYTELSNVLNCYEKTLFMKREKIISRGLWRAKKNYIIQVYDNEGVRYHEAKIIPVGIEIVRSSTPELVKTALKETLQIILNGTESDLISQVSEFKKKYLSSAVIDIAFPRGVNDIEKWKCDSYIWKKGTPIHVKGSLVFNNLVEKQMLTKVVPTIASGTKIKFVYLKNPNPIQANVISFIDNIPDSFGIADYIDYETQFEKSYLIPVKSFTDIVGWEVEKKSSISAFFSDDESKKTNQQPIKFLGEQKKPKQKKVDSNSSLSAFF